MIAYTTVQHSYRQDVKCLYCRRFGARLEGVREAALSTVLTILVEGHL
jgi:hypothetical protein